MRNTITTNSQSTVNYLTAANNIMDFMDDLGFTSETKHDTEMIKHTIAQFIREAIEGNTNTAYETLFSEDGIDTESIPTLFDAPECDERCPCNNHIGEEIPITDISQVSQIDRIKDIIESLENEQCIKRCKCDCGCENE